ncbi:MAG: LysM peptidoglycan-binding domain-containing protein [Clostridium sp.]|nr:LysM peptidoglycan-binding domain-containing protein [Clostridium sp.]
MKKLFLFLAMGLCAMAWAFANVNHVVEPGETLKSIAQKYGVTEAKIIELNPDAAQFIYVGMELNIPANAAVAQSAASTSNTSSSSSTYDNASYSEEDESKWFGMGDIHYGFLQKTKGMTNNNFGYSFTMGAGYKLYEGLYVGARIGYNSANMHLFASEKRGGYVEQKTNYHFISVPLELGYILGDKVGLIPHAGIDLNMCVSAKTKYKDTSSGEFQGKPKKPFGADFNFGLRIKLWEFTINGGYHIPLNKGQKDAFGKDPYLSVGIGFFM